MALLSLGSSGSDVVALQNKLGKLGLFSGTTTGTFDAATRDAAITFQKRYPWLMIDGIVGDMTFGEINDAVSEIDGQAALEAFASSTSPLNMANLNQNPLLCLAVQRKLRGLGLYPGGKLVDGDFGSRSQTALKEFLARMGLTVSSPLQFEPVMARKLLDTLQIPSILDEAKDPIRVTKRLDIFQQLVGASDAKLGFLDMGATKSPFKKYIHKQPEYLAATKLSGIKTSPLTTLNFSAYPSIGKFPKITTENLNFLDSDITEACVCLGNFDGSSLTTTWLGRKADNPVECLSATKIIPILNVLCKAGDQIPSNLSDLILTSQGNRGKQLELYEALIDICSYRISVPYSNALAGTLNAFEGKREEWIKGQTGNPKPIKFGGKYLEPQISRIPEIRDQSANKPIVEFQKSIVRDNDISVYDLTRFVSFVGWHLILPEAQQISGISDVGIALAVAALGTDTARYVDTAISTLGLENVVSSLIVLSKLGYGPSGLIYTAFVQFVDQHNANDPKLRTFAMTLRSSKSSSSDNEAIRVDTAIATAVTEIIRRIVTDDFE
jgi:peptidoglycan hydrolase-like protein with peptidoglycan-binding domain